ncbi:CCAAT/enhancer-binding protein gamma [Halotydeus destructor]|nr:CCAAT/enhancer-binding protein gamma [Halotydeus destructor]
MAPISKKRAILGLSDYSEFMSSSDSVCNSDTESNSNMSSSIENHLSDHLDIRQYARVNRVILDKNSDEYRRRRERNNLAVKKSRTKSKLKTIQTIEKVSALRSENDHLHHKVDMLSRELRLLKEIFMAHASSAHGTEITELDLKLLTGSDMFGPFSQPPSPSANGHLHEVPELSSCHQRLFQPALQVPLYSTFHGQLKDDY